MDKPELTRAVFEFIQDGNTDGTTSEYELLRVEFESVQMEPPGYIVLRTEGWSIDEPEDLSNLLFSCSQYVKGLST